MGSPKYQDDGDPRTSGPGFALTLHPEQFEIPYRWRAPRTVFVNSMSDLFHPDVPLEFIRRVFTVMAETRGHTYQILTKRSKPLASLAGGLEWPSNVRTRRERGDQPLRVPHRPPTHGRRGGALRQCRAAAVTRSRTLTSPASTR